MGLREPGAHSTRTLPSMPPRFHTDTALQSGGEFELPAGAARHVQVLRLQPGAAITLFDGRGGEWSASVVRMGRSEVLVRVDRFDAVERELRLNVILAVGMPANERMDGLVEKATELGVAAIQPLLCERSVLRLSGERALKKVAHWQAVAVAACEQSGRTRVPNVAPVRRLLEWLADLPTPDRASHRARIVLSLRVLPGASPLAQPLTELLCLSGPEGGFTELEEHAAAKRGFAPLLLGPRTLRADTAPLALLAHIALSAPAQTESPE
jgi:16S rRNA (uracil1498-N3)-methyltransferase